MSLMHRHDFPWPGEHRLPGFDLPGFEFDVTNTLRHPSLAVRWAGRELLDDERIAETVDYPFAIVGYALQGLHTIHYEYQKLKVEPGMVFWIKNFEDAVRTSVPGTFPVSLLVMLVGDDIDRWWSQCFDSPVGCAQLPHPHAIESVMMDIMEEGRFDSPHKEENCAALAKVLLRRIGDAIKMKREDKQAAKATYRRCRQYICAHFSSVRSLAQVAEACDVSVPYICRLFEVYGETSPYGLLTKLRMSRAAMMLATTQMHVSKIAHQVGYRNIPQFSRMFKAIYGVPPSRFAHTVERRPGR